VKGLLVPSSALLWGLQLAFLSPALALILVNLYGATTAQVGWVLGIYNASGFVASILLPAYADKKNDYLGPMLVCGALTLLLAVVLAFVTSLPIATLALVVIGGPAGVGSSMLYAHLRHSGARPADIVNTRAIVSVAWVAGPPLATFIIGWFGNRAILLAIAVVAVLNIVTTAVMISHRKAATRAAAATGDSPSTPAAATPQESPVSRTGIVLIMAAFILLQATNAAAMTIMTLYVTETLQLDVMWAGIALGVAAALEVPALISIGPLSDRYSHLGLIATGCLAGIAYYLGLAFVTGPIVLIVLQVLNAWFLRRHRRHRPTPVSADDLPSGPVHRALHEHSPCRLDRRRTHHRARLAHRPRATRDLPYQCSPHFDRPGHHRHRQPNESASPKRPAACDNLKPRRTTPPVREVRADPRRSPKAPPFD
jgi:SET family sugar efflux transporter-like MFS transporter